MSVKSQKHFHSPWHESQIKIPVHWRKCLRKLGTNKCDDKKRVESWASTCVFTQQHLIWSPLFFSTIIIEKKKTYTYLLFSTNYWAAWLESILRDAITFCRVDRHSLVYVRCIWGNYLKVDSKETDPNMWCIFRVEVEEKHSSANQGSVTNESGSESVETNIWVYHF